MEKQHQGSLLLPYFPIITHLFTALQPSLCWDMLSSFQHHRSLPQRPSFSSTLSIILFSLGLSYTPHIHLYTLYPCYPLISIRLLFLLPFTATVSVLLCMCLLGWGIVKKLPFLPPSVFLPQYKDYFSTLEKKASAFHAVCLKRKSFWAWFDLIMEEKSTLKEKLKIATEHCNK